MSLTSVHLSAVDSGDTWLTWQTDTDVAGVHAVPEDQLSALAHVLDPGAAGVPASILDSWESESAWSSRLGALLVPERLWMLLLRHGWAGRPRPRLWLTPSPRLATIPWGLLRCPSSLTSHPTRLAHLVDIVCASAEPLLHRPDASGPSDRVLRTIDPHLHSSAHGFGHGRLLTSADRAWLEQQLSEPPDEVLRRLSTPGTRTSRGTLATALVTCRPRRWLYLGHATADLTAPEQAALHLSDGREVGGSADLIGAHRPFTVHDLYSGAGLPTSSGWVAPERVALLACSTGAGAAAAEPFGFAGVLIASGARWVTVTRWDLPTDEGRRRTLHEDRHPLLELTAAVDAAHTAGDPVDAINAWVRERLTAWDAAGDPADSPITYGSLCTYEAVADHDGAPVDVGHSPVGTTERSGPVVRQGEPFPGPDGVSRPHRRRALLQGEPPEPVPPTTRPAPEARSAFERGLGHLRRQEPEPAVAAFTAALVASRNAGDRLNAAHALLDRGHAFRLLGEPERAAEDYAHAADLYASSLGNSQMAEEHLLRCEASLALLDLDTGLYHKAAATLATVGNELAPPGQDLTPSAAECRLNEAIARNAIGEHEQARALLRSLEQTECVRACPRLRGLVALHLATLDARTGGVERPEQNLADLTALLDEPEHEVRGAEAALHLGNLLLRLGRYDRAAHWLARALATFRSHRLPRRTLDAEMSATMVSAERGAPLDALVDRLREIETTYDRHGAENESTDAAFNRAILVRRLGRTAEAADGLSRAIDRYTELGLRDDAARARFTLAASLAQLRRWARASTEVELARAAWVELGDSFHVASCDALAGQIGAMRLLVASPAADDPEAWRAILDLLLPAYLLLQGVAFMLPTIRARSAWRVRLADLRSQIVRVVTRLPDRRLTVEVVTVLAHPPRYPRPGVVERPGLDGQPRVHAAPAHPHDPQGQRLLDRYWWLVDARYGGIGH